MYAIVKADVSEPIGVTTRHVIISQYGGRLQSKGLHYLRTEMNDMQEKESIIGVSGYQPSDA